MTVGGRTKAQKGGITMYTNVEILTKQRQKEETKKLLLMTSHSCRCEKGLAGTIILVIYKEHVGGLA